MQFMMITNKPEIARYIEEQGVSRIFVDQETLGKQARQGHLNTHKANHTNDDVRAIASVVRKSELMVRVNPLNEDSQREVDSAISSGATRLMLPMFYTDYDVVKFRELVAGRVPITFLAETKRSLDSLESWVGLLEPESDEVHIGLNDLSLDLGLSFLFEPLALGVIDRAAQVINEIGISWGFGGIARIETGELPAEKVLGEHVRLGSTRLILSRAFHHEACSVEGLLKTLDFPDEIGKLNDALDFWKSAGLERLEENRSDVVNTIFKIVGRKV